MAIQGRPIIAALLCGLVGCSPEAPDSEQDADLLGRVADPTASAFVVHFGGEEPDLLGSAGKVDSYNQDHTQTAVVFVNNFATYCPTQLAPDEMAVMIAIVASHELGHLPGLYHTRDPDGIVDATGAAADLAQNQSFVRSELDASIFATGAIGLCAVTAIGGYDAAADVPAFGPRQGG